MERKYVNVVIKINLYVDYSVLAFLQIVLAVLARKYSYSADCDTAYKEFPIAEPKNGLPVFMQRYALGY